MAAPIDADNAQEFVIQELLAQRGQQRRVRLRLHTHLLRLADLEDVRQQGVARHFDHA
ncbi:MAG: hypothetical protein GZ093_16075 [Rhodoferax sp.]|uniref:hypothetical protein n=1 Tax=Rhodoferax sp. TaxID=50421 RepID=UPI0013FEFE99|nr:hypothetical protein [Rhodoferax sp.]NDP40238.1 hypothetical protein [Rhodoferax sp.]